MEACAATEALAATARADSCGMALRCGACLQPTEKAANRRKTAETLRIENIVREPRNDAALLFILGGVRHPRHKLACKRSARGTMACDIHERTRRGTSQADGKLKAETIGASPSAPQQHPG